MTAYVDASFLVSLFVADANTPAADAFVETGAVIRSSTWGVAEFSSAPGVRHRRDELTAAEVRDVARL